MIIKYIRTETYTFNTNELKDWFEFDNEEDAKETLTDLDSLKILLEDVSHSDLIDISKYHWTTENKVQIV